MQYIKKTSNFLIFSSIKKKDITKPFSNPLPQLTDKIIKDSPSTTANEKNKMLIFRNPNSKNIKVNMYDDLSKKRIDNLVSMNTENAYNLQKKTLTKIQSSGAKAFVTKAALLKLISLIYSEKIKNLQNRYNPLLVISYDFTLNRFGIKKIADTKYMQFLETCCFYSDIFRVQMFSRFLKLFEKFENEEFDFYIKCLKSLDEV